MSEENYGNWMTRSAETMHLKDYVEATNSIEQKNGHHMKLYPISHDGEIFAIDCRFKKPNFGLKVFQYFPNNEEKPLFDWDEFVNSIYRISHGGCIVSSSFMEFRQGILTLKLATRAQGYKERSSILALDWIKKTISTIDRYSLHALDS